MHPIAEGEFPLENFEGEVLHFPTNCHGCGSPGQTNMKLTSILKTFSISQIYALAFKMEI